MTRAFFIHYNQKMDGKLLVVKVGTQVLTDNSGNLDLGVLQSLIRQISELHNQGYKVVLVSSGAVGAGRAIKPNYSHTKVLAAIGQLELMTHYKTIAAVYTMQLGQILVTKEDFKTRRHYLNIRDTILEMLEQGILPIANENDVISNPEITFTDNDELAGLLTTMLGAQRLIILSNVDGVFTGHPDEAESKLIHQIDPAVDNYEQYISSIKSSRGRGGMASKCKVAARLADLGITTTIAHGRKQDIMLEIVKNHKVGTNFIPKQSKSNIKRWIANTQAFYSGEVIINKGAEEKLLSMSASLLPIGIIGTKGEFKQRDLIKLTNQYAKIIGYGLCNYDSNELKLKMGKSKQREFIHYNYLYLLNHKDG